MQKYYRLPNKVRVYLWQWPAPSVGIAVTLDSGSRHDPCQDILDRLLKRNTAHHHQGLNHLLEHVTTRASRKWPSWEATAEHADGTCSDQNAETDKTTLAVYASTDRSHASSTIEFLADMIVHPIISQTNFDQEQERARQEYREYADQPAEIATLQFDRLMFGPSGLAHPVLGTEETIRRMTIDDIRNYRRRVVCGRRVIVSVAGNFHPEQIKVAIRKAFGSLPPGRPKETPRLDYRQLRGGIHLRSAPTHQVYCVLGFPMFGINHPDRMAMSILHNHLSGSTRASSRIKVATSSRGFGYSALDGFVHWPDIGQWVLDIPVSPERFLETLRIVAGVIGETRKTLLPPKYHQLAITNLCISAKSRFGDPLRTAIFIGAFMANAGTFTPLRKYIQQIRGVSRRRIRAVAQQVLDRSRLCLVAHGPLKDLTKRDISQALNW